MADDRIIFMLGKKNTILSRVEDDIYSENNKLYVISSNNSNNAIKHFQYDSIEKRKLLEAEYAVFSGKLLKLILGKQQPDTYLAQSMNSYQTTYW